MKTQLNNNYIPKNKINNICIVSNHVPNELENIKELFAKQGINVDIYGIHHRYELITAELLAQYEVVISIGKTINLSIAMGIPCYVYDHFGGDSYIRKNNIRESFNYNFSGRYKRVKYTSEQLVNSILAGYNEAVNDLKYCQEFAVDNFLFENVIDNTFLKMNKKPINYQKIAEDYKQIIRKAPVLVREIGRRELQITDNKLFFQIYYKNDCNYNEYDSIKVDITNNSFHLKKKFFPEKVNVRLDLVNKAGFKIENLIINNQTISDIMDYHINGFLKIGETLISINDDPWIELENVKDLEISFSVKDINSDILNDYLSDNFTRKDKLINATKYVKGIMKPKLVMIIDGEFLPGTLVIKNNNGNILKSIFTYNFETDQTVIETQLNSHTLHCYQRGIKTDEEY